MNDETVTCAFVYSAEQYERGQKVFEKALPFAKKWGGIFIVVPFVGLVAALNFFFSTPVPRTPPSDDLGSRLLNVVPVLVIFGLVIWLLVRRQKKSAGKFAYIDEPVTNVLSESGLRFESPLTEVHFKWPVFSRVLETDEGFVLISGHERLFTWLPKNGFDSSDSIRRARELMRRQVTNASGLFPG